MFHRRDDESATSPRLPRIPSESLENMDELRRHGRPSLETKTGKIQAVDDLLLSKLLDDLAAL